MVRDDRVYGAPRLKYMRSGFTVKQLDHESKMNSTLTPHTASRAWPISTLKPPRSLGTVAVHLVYGE